MLCYYNIITTYNVMLLQLHIMPRYTRYNVLLLEHYNYIECYVIMATNNAYIITTYNFMLL